MKTKHPKNTSAVCSFNAEQTLKKAVEAYAAAKNTSPSKVYRLALIKFLAGEGFLPKDYSDTLQQGGNRYSAKLADPTTRDATLTRLRAQASSARAAKSKNSKITISGNLNAPITQKKL